MRKNTDKLNITDRLKKWHPLQKIEDFCVRHKGSLTFSLFCSASLLLTAAAGNGQFMFLLFYAFAFIPFSAGDGGKADSEWDKIQRFSVYQQILADMPGMSLKELARRTGHTTVRVRKDISEMISRGMLPNLELDERENFLIRKKESTFRQTASIKEERCGKVTDSAAIPAAASASSASANDAASAHGYRSKEEHTMAVRDNIRIGISAVFSAVAAFFLGLSIYEMSLLRMEYFVPLIYLIVLFLIIGVFSLRKNLKNKKLRKHYFDYMEIIGDRETCSIRELAEGTHRTRKEVREELRDMIQAGMFGGHTWLDRKKSMLMLTHEAHEKYLAEERERKEQERKEKQRREQQRKEENEHDGGPQSVYSGEIRNILEQGEAFTRHVHEVNDLIREPVFSEKLDRLEQTVTRIFNQLRRRPESAPDLHRLMDYYLPTTRKLIDVYAQIGENPEPGSSAEKLQQEILSSLDIINDAYAALLDSFFEDMEMDVSSDIAVIQTMMAGDGLIGSDDFKRADDVSRTEEDITGVVQKKADNGPPASTVPAHAPGEIIPEKKPVNFQGGAAAMATPEGSGVKEGNGEEQRE